MWSYEDLLLGFRNAGYKPVDFFSLEESRSLVMRHDIDFCVDAAYEVAEIENANGVTATYFFMLSTDNYNLLSDRCLNTLAKISAMGHTISLHFDPALYDDVDEGFDRERAIFERATGVKISIVSLHRPQGFLDDNNRQLDNCRHTYEDEFFNDIKYVSDSGGAFRYGHPYETPEFRNGDNIHLLIHPIWWVYKNDNPSEKIRAWQRRHFDFLNQNAIANCKSFDGTRAQ